MIDHGQILDMIDHWLSFLALARTYLEKNWLETHVLFCTACLQPRPCLNVIDCACTSRHKGLQMSGKVLSLAEMAYRFSDISDIGKYWLFFQIWDIISVRDCKLGNIRYQISAEANHRISDIRYRLEINRYAIPDHNMSPCQKIRLDEGGDL